jgi:hypothetical protein
MADNLTIAHIRAIKTRRFEYGKARRTGERVDATGAANAASGRKYNKMKIKL